MIDDMHVPKSIFESTVGPDGIIYLTLSGRITNAHLEEVAAWAEKVKADIEAKGADDAPVLILCDVSGVTHFETKPVSVLRDLLAHNRKYKLLTAVVGPNGMVAMLLDALIALTHRTNIKKFPAKKEAMEWLFDSAKRAI